MWDKGESLLVNYLLETNSTKQGRKESKGEGVEAGNGRDVKDGAIMPSLEKYMFEFDPGV